VREHTDTLSLNSYYTVVDVFPCSPYLSQHFDCECNE
jgi:hypothetical protein